MIPQTSVDILKHLKRNNVQNYGARIRREIKRSEGSYARNIVFLDENGLITKNKLDNKRIEIELSSKGDEIIELIIKMEEIMNETISSCE